MIDTLATAAHGSLDYGRGLFTGLVAGATIGGTIGVCIGLVLRTFSDEREHAGDAGPPTRVMRLEPKRPA